MSIIKPTVGRVVWYYPTMHDPGGVAPGGPFAAIVAWVWPDETVNLHVIDSDGGSFARVSVKLVQDELNPPAGCCGWMPYQKGQAARTEALEKQLAGP